MNGPQLKALVRDAIYQVLDNWVFRILAVLTLIPILLTFAVAFREDEIVFFFGVKRWDYAGLLEFFGVQGLDIVDAQGLVIEGVLTLVFDYLAGSIGVLFCIAATAFFVPRMVEKGAADVLFHKPLGRLIFYLSRFMAGLFFIGIIAAITVVGMYAGILLMSGHNDPGIFFAALSLTYVFGLVYSVCMLIGILTRSTVASILVTVIFFFFNGCVHSTWINLEQTGAASEASNEVSQIPDEEVEEVEEVDEDAPEEREGLLERGFFATLNTLHYGLPKTTDADYISRKIRRAVDPPLYRDEGALVTVYRMPSDAERIAPEAFDASSIAPAAQELLGELRFAVRVTVPEEEQAIYSLWRRPVVKTEVERNGRTRVRRESATKAASTLQDALEEAGVTDDVERDLSRFGSSAKGVPAGAVFVDWVDGPRKQVAVLFKGAELEWLYTLWIDAPAEGMDTERRDKILARMDRSMGIDSNILNKISWYEEQLGLGSQLKYNILFSVGSSLGFVALMLILGWWRLMRIEF